MDDKDVIKEITAVVLSQSGEHTRLVTIAIATAALNLIALLLNMFIQFSLKNKEVDVNKKNLREARKIAVYEEIYDKMNKMSLEFENDKQDALLSLTKELDALSNSKRLYINADDFNLINRFNDYFRQVAVAPNMKDYFFERKTLDALAENFNS